MIACITGTAVAESRTQPGCFADLDRRPILYLGEQKHDRAGLLADL